MDRCIGNGASNSLDRERNNGGRSCWVSHGTNCGGGGGGGDSIAASLAIAKLVEETSFCVRVGAV